MNLDLKFSQKSTNLNDQSSSKNEDEFNINQKYNPFDFESPRKNVEVGECESPQK